MLSARQLRLAASCVQIACPTCEGEESELNELFAGLKLAATHKQAGEDRTTEYDRRQRLTVPQVVPSWTGAEIGQRVERSAHYIAERRGVIVSQWGLLTDLKHFADDLCGMVAYPVIFWEGAAFASMCHPSNAAPVSGTLPTITMNANQQATTDTE